MSIDKNDAPELIRAVPVKHWGRWISAVIVAILAAMLAHGLIYNEKFHWDIVFSKFFIILLNKRVPLFKPIRFELFPI